MSQLRSVTNEAQKKDYGMGRNSLSEDLETSAAKNCEICPETSNPIIFARTETTHIPKHLLEVSQHQKLRDAIYSAQEDGSLKPTPLDSIKETDSDEEKEQLARPRKMGFFKRLLYYICCLCDSMDQEIQFFGGDACDPVLSVTSPPGGEIQDSQFETPTGPFLGEQSDTNQGRKTLVLDLDETLVHSTFQPTDDCSYVIPVEIEGDFYNVYVYLRPGTTEFLRRMSEIYEVVVYTASLPVYADPLLDKIDPNNLISARLFRDHCVQSGGILVKDLGLLGRNLDSVVMIDNSAVSFQFQPNNGIECVPFIDDMQDRELIEMIPFLEYLSKKSDVRQYVTMWNAAREAKLNNVYIHLP